MKAENKKNILLVQGRDVPLLGVHKLREYDHMLRDPDKQRFSDICAYLLKNEITPYLGGGVLEQYLYTGRRDYSDIDILGVSRRDKEPLEVARTLKRAAKHNGIIMGKSAFIVEDTDLIKKIYMNMINIDERFILKPLETPSELNSGQPPSQIDISIVSKKVWDKYIKKNQITLFHE